MMEIELNKFNRFIIGITILHMQYVKGASWAAKLKRLNTRIYGLDIHIGFFTLRLRPKINLVIPFTKPLVNKAK